ncbi:hypothetical protein LCGC14_2613400 [marine sediment metagenome]|uniref:Uncharacterized protein n=1 Tax=marine sediment metagenome TaxID=412755 RepID=A0A0F9ASX9_9ZZZZ
MKYLKVYFLDGRKPTFFKVIKETKTHIKGYKCNLCGLRTDLFDNVPPVILCHSIIRKTVIYKRNKYHILKERKY